VNANQTGVTPKDSRWFSISISHNYISISWQRFTHRWLLITAHLHTLSGAHRLDGCLFYWSSKGESHLACQLCHRNNNEVWLDYSNSKHVFDSKFLSVCIWTVKLTFWIWLCTSAFWIWDQMVYLRWQCGMPPHIWWYFHAYLFNCLEMKALYVFSPYIWRSHKYLDKFTY
jgi:hypothetical protein